MAYISLTYKVRNQLPFPVSLILSDMIKLLSFSRSPQYSSALGSFGDYLFPVGSLLLVGSGGVVKRY